MEKLRVEDGIPIPPKRARGRKPSTVLLTFRAMKVGDSAKFECSDKMAGFEQRKISGILNAESKRSGAGFAIRRDEGGIRFWRTK